MGWDADQREKHFEAFVRLIANMVMPNYLNLVKGGEVIVSTKDELNGWTKVERSVIHFAKEGIRKSVEFCFQMILRQIVVRIQTRMFHTNNRKDSFLRGKRFEWCQNEIRKRLGIKSYKIWENINNYAEMLEYDVNPKMTIPGSDLEFDYNIRKIHSETNEVTHNE